MLRTNLSTRPFYNERLVYLVIGLAALLVLALTVFNGVRLASLTQQDRVLRGRTQATEQQVQKLRQEASHARSRLDRAELQAVAAAAREANTLIDRRTFSWTELLNRLENTLPADVRIQSIAPVPREGGPLEVNLVVVAHRPEDVDAFVEQLQKNGGFGQVISQAETTTQQGLLEVTLQGQYLAR